MRKTIRLNIAVLSMATLIVCGCVTAKAPERPGGTSQKSNLTPGMVKATIVEGTTGQVEILRVFGAPNIVTRDTDGQEVWAYDVQSTASSAGTAEWQAGGGLVGGAATARGHSAGGVGAGVGGSSGKGSSVSQVSSSTFTLLITFNDRDVVSNYQMMSTKF